ncbi:MAG: helix-turn-helix domain-containing protein [Candidatus Dojkabacteria bacterium]|jgi:transcriptional regulator with XRE-family HTH domain
MSFRKNLEYLRKGKKLSQEDLADKLDVSRQSVSKWESGSAYPETEKILAICKIFDCTLDELMNQDMQEEKLEESRKYTFNDFLKSVTGIVDRSIRMITSMNAKSLFKFIFEIGVLLVLIALMRLPFQYIYDAGANIFVQIGNKYSSILLAFWEFLTDIVYLVVAVVSFVYIYKVRFLDAFDDIEDDISRREKIVKKEDLSVKSEVSSRKRDITVKYDFGVFSILGRAVLFLFKCFVAFCSLFVVFFFLCSVGGVVVVISWFFEKIYFFGVLLFLLTLIVFLGTLIVVLYNFILDRKSAWKKILVVLLVTLIGFGISAGVGFLEFKEFSVNAECGSTLILDMEVREFEMRDDLVVQVGSGPRSYVVDNSLGNMIRVEVKYSKKYSVVHIDERENDILVSRIDKGISFRDIYKVFLHDLKRKELRENYRDAFGDCITVYSSEENIAKLQQNWEKRVGIYIQENEEDYPCICLGDEDEFGCECELR